MGTEETDTDALKFHQENKEKMIVIPSREMEPGSQNFPVPAVQGGQDGFPRGCTAQTLVCSALMPAQVPKRPWPIPEFAQSESNTSKQTFMMFFLLCIKSIPCLTWILKIQSRLVLPSIVYLCLENPIQGLP